MRNIFCILLACLLADCIGDKPNPIGCDQIAALRAQVGTETSPEQFRDRVSRSYQLPSEAVTLGAASIEAAKRGTVSIVRWHTDNFQYGASLDDRAIRSLVVSGTSAPVDSLISCLGESAWYLVRSSGVESGVQRTVELFFPDQGIALYGWYYVPFNSQSQPPAKSDRLFWDIMFMKSGPVEQVVNYYYAYDPALAQDVLQKIKPWPGGWAKIEFPPYPE